MFAIPSLLPARADLPLFAIAAIVCTVACWTTLRLLARAQGTRGRVRLNWLAGAALTFAAGAWFTHFVIAIAHAEGPGAFQVPLTLLAFAAAVAGALPGFAAALGRGRGHAALGGTLAGLGAGTAHLAGFTAWRGTAMIAAWPLAVLLLGIPAAAAALTAHRDARLARNTLIPTLLLAFAVCAPLIADPRGTFREAPDGAVGGASLAIAVAVVGLLLVALALAMALFEETLRGRDSDELRRLHKFADATHEGLVFHRSGVVLDANGAFERLSFWPQDRLIGQRVAELLGETLAAPGAGDAPMQTELVCASGDRVPVEVLTCAIERGEESALVTAVRDIRERRAAEQRISFLAEHDSLTGLANRALFGERLTQALALAKREGHRVAVHCIDLDRFKTTNDTLGHAIGDRLLVEVGRRLRAIVRASDTVARLGGDEFAFIQSVTRDPEGAGALASRLVEALAAPYLIDGNSIAIGVSIGVAVSPDDGGTPTALLQHADVALVSAKADGGSCSRFFDPAMAAKLRLRYLIEHDLRCAIEAGDLELHYQPQFEARSLRLTGYEALVRWHHRERGFIPPAEFIPLAEESGLIVALGRWVLRAACAEAATWPSELAVAVNLCPMQFAQEDLPGTIGESLAEFDLPPSRLVLEITEGVLFAGTERSLAALRALKAMGVRIALDDFGTGYSSLSYLHRFPFDVIKIDQGFVRGLGKDDHASAIVRSVAALCHHLKLVVLAEGVETEQQLKALQSYGCDQVQGFLLGRPERAEVLPHKPPPPSRQPPEPRALPALLASAL